MTENEKECMKGTLISVYSCGIASEVSPVSLRLLAGSGFVSDSRKIQLVLDMLDRSLNCGQRNNGAHFN